MFTYPRINRSSPHAQNLRYCWPFFAHTSSVRQELVSGADATLDVESFIVPGPHPSIMTSSYNGSSADGVAAINIGDVSSITLAFWLMWTSYGTNNDIAFEYTTVWDNNTGSPAQGDGFVVLPNASSGAFLVGCGGLGGGARSRSLSRPSGSVWHHYVVPLDRTLAWGVPYVMVDGQSVTLTDTENSSINTTFFANANLFFMCRNGTTLFGAGRLCDVRLYAGKILSTAEAWALYDPRTRWDLYLPIEEPRQWTVPAVSAPTPRLLASLGVGR